MSLEKTLVILKPSAVQRGLIGEITTRFERKGLRLAGMKMMQLTDELLNEHYAHLSEKPFFQRVKNSMMASPVIVCCYEGVDAIQVVRSMTGATNGRVAIPGTIRGTSVSVHRKTSFILRILLKQPSKKSTVSSNRKNSSNINRYTCRICIIPTNINWYKP